jgi:hypothetical protein
MGLHCPKCGSSRVRRGYETPPLPLRLLGIHGLLCDNCNLTYRGFAIPGTVPDHPTRKSRHYRRSEERPEPEQLSPSEDEQKVRYSHRRRAHDASAQPSETFSFLWYYVKLRFSVLLGLYHTSHPLGLKYRWRNWQHWQRHKDS